MKPNDKKKQQTALQKLAERLHNPLQFRIFVTVVMLAVGYVGVYMPLSERITKSTKGVRQAKEYQNLLNQVDEYKGEIKRISARLPKDTDTNEWVQYLFEGLRKFPLKLSKIDSDTPKNVGPYQAVVLQLELRGTYEGLDSFLKWIETNERLFRIDALTVRMTGDPDRLEIKLKILGLKG